MSDESRGQDIQRRRLALGITSYRQFEEAVADETGIRRGTLAKAEAGDASPNTYAVLDAWLARQEVENGMDIAPAQSEPLKIEMHGVYGIEEIIVSGPVDRPDELAEAVGKILDRLKRGED